MIRFLLLFALVNVIHVDSARILGLFPVPSISHQVVFRALTQELARRGHELVIVTPNPALPKDRPSDNVTEIDVSFGYQVLMNMTQSYKTNFKRGVVAGSEVHLQEDGYKFFIKMIVDMMECPELKKITSDKTQHFDLILVEAFFNYQMIFSEIFKAPMILFSSFHGLTQSFEAIGAITQHPTLYPSIFRDIYGGVSVIDKFNQVKFEYQYQKAMEKLEAFEDECLRKNYGPNAPTVKDLRKNVDMLFLNSYPIFCDNKPLPPNAVYVGPLHLKPLKELPQEMKTYLDNSKNGVIYVSLGTNVNPANMDKDLLEAFVETFRELPYDILWKFNGVIENLPENVRIQEWFPQRDLLVHPKIKLFVMQGGLQSTDEAIDAEVPLVGIPMLGDQYFNVHKYEQLGIGVKLDALTLDKEALLNGILTVLNDESYKKNIKKLKEIMNDQPQSSLERAVWWSEYVIRHGGAKHLRSPSVNMTWAEYLLADVAAAVLSAVLVALSVAYLAVSFLVRKLFRSGKIKMS